MSIQNKILKQFYNCYYPHLKIKGIALGRDDFAGLKEELYFMQRYPHASPDVGFNQLAIQLPSQPMPTIVYLTVGFEGIGFIMGE